LFPKTFAAIDPMASQNLNPQPPTRIALDLPEHPENV
jgi:hypothetical protein